MSRVHDALRKAGQQGFPAPRTYARPEAPSSGIEGPPASSSAVESSSTVLVDAPILDPGIDDLEAILENATELPFNPLSDALLVNPAKPREAPAEEFRSLRTRLNHLQTLQPLHTLVVTSASPAEGKSFTAINLAITQAQLADKRVLLADFDFRRPSVEKTFQISVSPGITDYLVGKAPLRDVIRKIGGTNLYVMTAGDPVINPLELLNLKECKALIEGLRDHFDLVILDTPPLLFAADGSLLATMCDGTILVVRIGTTTFDAVTRALQSLCENNILGIVVNGARRGELYSKYTYYHDYYTPDSEVTEEADPDQEEQLEPDED